MVLIVTFPLFICVYVSSNANGLIMRVDFTD